MNDDAMDRGLQRCRSSPAQPMHSPGKSCAAVGLWLLERSAHLAEVLVTLQHRQLLLHAPLPFSLGTRDERNKLAFFCLPRSQGGGQHQIVVISLPPRLVGVVAGRD